MRATPPSVSRRARERACDLIRNRPLRWRVGDSERAEDEVLKSGWFEGADECARVLSVATTATRSCGTAFGEGWPVLQIDGKLVVPAIPAAVGVDGTPIAGIDGEYHVEEDGIHREAVGIESLAVATKEYPATNEESFDLLWFGDTERFILRSGILEIEDLFAACRVPASASLLEKVLVRGRRLDPKILDGVPSSGTMKAPEIEVRRPAELSTESRWRNAIGFLSNRTDILGAQRDGSQISFDTAARARGRFVLDESAEGWRLDRTEGNYPFLSFSLFRSVSFLSLRATLAPEIDPLAPGMRGRLSFDLRADLVALG